MIVTSTFLGIYNVNDRNSRAKFCASLYKAFNFEVYKNIRTLEDWNCKCPFPLFDNNLHLGYATILC